jgi:hypothetical protein
VGVVAGCRLVGALVVAAVVFAGCGDDDAGPATALPATSGALLRALAPVGDEIPVVKLQDIELLVADAGLDGIPDEADDPGQADEVRREHANDWGMVEVASDLGAVAGDWVEALGFGPSAVARAGALGGGSDEVVTVTGDVDHTATLAVLRSWSPEAEMEETDPWTLVDEPGDEGELAQPGPLNRVGWPMRYAVAPGRFVRSTSADRRDAAVAALDGAGPTLVDEPAWGDVADAADERRWYSVYATTMWSPIPEWQEQENPADLPPRALVRVAALSVVDDAPLPQLAFVYDDESSAEEAERILAQRLGTTTDHDGEPWRDLSPDASVTRAGAMVVVEWPGAEPRLAERAILAEATIARTR